MPVVDVDVTRRIDGDEVKFFVVELSPDFSFPSERVLTMDNGLVMLGIEIVGTRGFGC